VSSHCEWAAVVRLLAQEHSWLGAVGLLARLRSFGRRLSVLAAQVAFASSIWPVGKSRMVLSVLMAVVCV
jgi:hypothetical protein